MTKNLIVRFSVEDVDLPDLLSSLFNIAAGIPESDECLAVIEDFYVPTNVIEIKDHLDISYD